MGSRAVFARWLAAPAFWGGVLLAVLYIGFYFADPAGPADNFNPCCVRRWIGWGDQGLYYRSAQALWAGNLDPEQHWYPLGYAILAAPFSVLGNHRFFFVDLIALIAAYAAFIAFARRIGVSPPVAALLFLLTSCADTLVFEQWAIPWTTTPAAAVIWGLLAVGAGHLQGDRRPFLLGVLAGILPLLRPTDGVVSLICVAWLFTTDLAGGRLRRRDVLLVAAGAAVSVAPYLALHLAIYGPSASEYLRNSRLIGFTTHNLVWRAYVLLIEPRQWFFFREGQLDQGLIRRMYWLLLGFAGALWALRRGGPAALLAACLIAYGLLFLCYVDLLPTSLWTYKNIHYFKWMFPGLGLLAWLLLAALFRRQRLAWAALAVVLLLSCIRVTPRPVGPLELANMVDIPGPAATEADTTMEWGFFVVDDLGIAANVIAIRAFPFPAGDGVRLIGVRRDLLGSVKRGFSPGPDIDAATGPQRRWAEQVDFGYPCWLPAGRCKTAGP